MKIDTNLFNFLQFRDKILQIDDLETLYGLKLPPVYRAFITTYLPYFSNIQFEDSGSKNNFIYAMYPTEFGKEEYTIDDNSICPEYFKEPKELLDIDEDDMYDGWNGNLIFIAEHSYYGGLMLGIKEHNADKIYHRTDSSEITFVANNIFEFLQGVQYVQIPYDFPNLKLSELYRKWDEKFWRVKRDFIF